VSGNGKTGGTFPVRPELVLAAVADAYGVTTEDLTSPGRKDRLHATARAVAYRLLYDESWLSWTSVAKAMGTNGNGKTSNTAHAARRADPDAVEALRLKLRPDGVQGRLFGPTR
jgi:hypothetical protein